MLRAVIATAVLILLMAVTLLVSAGDLRWTMAWAFLVVYAAFAALALLTLDPDLIAERSRVSRDTRRFDLVVSSLFFVCLYPATLIVCGLDARFAWSPEIPVAVQRFALAGFGIGYGFSLWAMAANPFFSTMVRIQRERGHHVIDSGAYAIVRHPGYAGAMLSHLVLPVALGSLWGALPALCGIALLAVRTAWEDRLLAEELPGYRQYMLRVRWRLVPYVW